MSKWTAVRDKALDEINKEAKEAWAASWQMCVALSLFWLFIGWFVHSLFDIFGK